MQGERPDIVLPQWEALPDIGLYMDQVVTLMERAFSPALPKGEMTKSMVNNYVKVGLIPRPSGKKYDREHLAMLMMIGVLKQALSMESIAKLLDMLCADGVRKGYERFSEESAAVGEAQTEGRFGLQPSECPQREQALRAGIMAALCTIRTSRLLDALRGEKEA